MNEYVPSDQDIEDTYASTWLNFQNELGREHFRAWLAAHDARVRRDAARDLVDALCREGVTGKQHTFLSDYMSAHYPETGD